jgi:hypothetical protein
MSDKQDYKQKYKNLKDISSLLLPREPFLFVKEGNIYPYIPIHHVVVEYCASEYEDHPDRILTDFPELYKAFEKYATEELQKVAGEKTAHLMDKIREQIWPSRGIPYTISGIFNYNCDSVIVEYYNSFDYSPWEPEIGKENVQKLNKFIPLYINNDPNKPLITLVQTHNSRISRWDHIIEREWAIAVNNCIILHLMK